MFNTGLLMLALQQHRREFQSRAIGSPYKATVSTKSVVLPPLQPGGSLLPFQTILEAQEEKPENTGEGQFLSPNGPSHWNSRALQYEAPSPTGLGARIHPGHHRRMDWWSGAVNEQDLHERLNAASVESGSTALITQLEVPGAVNIHRVFEEDEPDDVLDELRAPEEEGGTGAKTSAVLLLYAEAVWSLPMDWMYIPLEVSVGSLTRIDHVQVVDVFGVQRSLVQATPRHFQCWSPLESSLWIPPVLPEDVVSVEVERVSVVKDEVSNLAWAIQEQYLASDGESRPVARSPVPPPSPPATTSKANEVPVPLCYTYAPAVPQYAVPYFPVRPDPRRRNLNLIRGNTGPPPLTQVVQKMSVVDQDILSYGGVQLSLAWNRVRWFHGQILKWSSRAVRFGLKGSKAPGLVYDRVQTTTQSG